MKRSAILVKVSFHSQPSGSFGSVCKIRRKSDGKILVWKEMNYGKMNEKEKAQLVSEVNIMRDLKDINIVRYYDR